MGNLLDKEENAETPKDLETVILYQFPRGIDTPSGSPFVNKLETFLRVAEIPYQNDLTIKMSKKSKIPWIKYNGEEIADTQLCIKFLTEKFGKDLNHELTTEQKAISRFMQRTIDEHLYWCLVLERWVYSDQETASQGQLSRFFNWMVYPRIVSKVTEQAQAQGTGRHSKEEVYEFAHSDFQALSNFLGDKTYMFGDQISEVDCCAFGALACAFYQLHDSCFRKWMESDFVNLKDYCERIKEKYWPDWDNIIGNKKEEKIEN